MTTDTTTQLKAIAYDNIMAFFATRSFGRVMAERIVGGPAKLARLVVAGAVEADKPNSTAQNGKYRYNAAQVLLHIRDARHCLTPKSHKSNQPTPTKHQ